jgi:hypothetical protein
LFLCSRITASLINSLPDFRLGTFGFAVVDDRLVVLAQLDLVVLDRLGYVLVLLNFIIKNVFHGVQQLQDVDRHREDLPSRLQHLVVLLLFLLLRLLVLLRVDQLLDLGHRLLRVLHLLGYLIRHLLIHPLPVWSLSPPRCTPECYPSSGSSGTPLCARISPKTLDSF